MFEQDFGTIIRVEDNVSDVYLLMYFGVAHIL